MGSREARPKTHAPDTCQKLSTVEHSTVSNADVSLITIGVISLMLENRMGKDSF